MKPEIRCNDNLTELKKVPGESVDLVYIDPPFFTNRGQKVSSRHWSRDSQVDYDDTWDSMDQYLDFMKPRLKELHRVLKDNGSIYIHLDPRASHYVKVEVDKMFGYDNFINEIVWYNKQGRRFKSHFNKKHDSILLYSKGKDFHFDMDAIATPPSESKRKEYSRVDENGRKFRTKYGKRYYMHDDWIDDVIYNPPPQSNETVGYATQKPMKLIETFVKASSKKGDIILDAFAGSGTTCAVAKNLGRKSICIDKNPKACKIMGERLK
jgi:site-specific DNA-methyltransferase (adenine-specific)